MAPTSLRKGRYRFFFYSSDKHEPVHVHVEKDHKVAKFWINPVVFHSSNGFNPGEILKIERIIKENEILIKEAWFPRLLEATKQEQLNWRLIGEGSGIHWEDIDEDISIAGLLSGKPSGESPASFKKWLEKRKKASTIR